MKNCACFLVATLCLLCLYCERPQEANVPSGPPAPRRDYFPTSADDWIYMAKYHDSFSDMQKMRALLQGLAMKLGQKCDCGIVNKVNAASNNEGRFWESAWYGWKNNMIENQKIIDIIVATIDSMDFKKDSNETLKVKKDTSNLRLW
jgi:hypothetical protein